MQAVELARRHGGLLELAPGHDQAALAAFRAAERMAGHLAVPPFLVPLTQARLLHALLRLGETERAEQALAELGEQDRDRGEIRIATAALRLAQHDRGAVTAALAPVVCGVCGEAFADTGYGRRLSGRRVRPPESAPGTGTAGQ